MEDSAEWAPLHDTTKHRIANLLRSAVESRQRCYSAKQHTDVDRWNYYIEGMKMLVTHSYFNGATLWDEIQDIAGSWR
jgi:hypothetical protein